MPANRTIVLTIVLIVLYDRLEFFYYVAEPHGAEPFIFWRTPWGLIFEHASFPFVSKECLRLDNYIYYASVKLQNFIFVYLVWLYIPVLRNYSKWIIISFGLCFLEYFLTYNEAAFLIPLPKFAPPISWFIPDAIPGSTATLKVGSIIYFGTMSVRHILRRIQ